MSGLLQDRRVLVTGAARGIGLAIAEAMLEQGAQVILSDIDELEIEAQVTRLCALEKAAHALALDITDDEGLKNAASGISERWGNLDVLVNNAAMLDIARFQDLDWDQWQRVLDTNLTSVAKVSKTFLNLLRKSDNPSVINTVSTQAMFGQPGSIAYATAKSGVMNLTRCMAIDLGEEGIRVNAVAPGFIDTRMALMPNGEHEHQQEDFFIHYIKEGRIPLRRPGKPEDCAGAYIYLASTLSQYVTGQVIAVDGGLTCSY